MEELLIVDGVWKKFGDKVVLKNVSLVVHSGEVVGLLGPNGAGKTTLLRIISGVLKPDQGRVSIKGFNPVDSKARALIGFCPQEPGLIADLTGFENMLFYARLQGLDGKSVIKRIKELLEVMGLTKDADRLVRKYSGGMKKKLGLATTLIHDPEILILDEPTTGMDPGVRREVWRIIEEERERGKGILIATHYMEEADALSDRVYIIDQGRIIASGSPEELKSKYAPSSVIIVEFYKQPRDLEGVLQKTGLKYIVDGDKVRIHSSDPDRDVPGIVALIHEEGGTIKTLHVAKPTLEDVFLKLTGRRIE
ncbi:MAG: ABC transporter ATP-binding protein [Desulfurococcales archaeon]|nr:ABC transporter ATP-binding protein [Desulfurococcales archaeon]